MKIKQKLISFTLIIAMSMGVATLPAFASSPDTSYFLNSSRYYWSGASGTHDLPASTKLGNLVAMGINFLSLDIASVKSTLSQIGTTLNTSISDGLKPIVDLKSLNWGSTLNLYTIPSSYGTSWYAQILRGLYDIKYYNSSIVGYLNTATGNQSTIINKLNSGIDVSLDSTIEGYIQNSSEQLTTQSSILSSVSSNISSYLPSINTNASNIYNIIHSAPARSMTWTSRGSIYDGFNINNITNGSTYITSLAQSANGSLGLLSLNGASNIADVLSSMHIDLLQLNTRLATIGTVYGVDLIKRDMTHETYTALSISDILLGFVNNTSSHLSALSYMLADPDAIAAKQANKPQEDNVLDNFTGSGDASASVNDFTGVKDSVSALKTSLSGGASYTQAFNILDGSSDGWSWFTNEVAESMDSTSNGNSRLRGVSDSTPYLDSYYSELSSYLGYSYNGGIE